MVGGMYPWFEAFNGLRALVFRDAFVAQAQGIIAGVNIFHYSPLFNGEKFVILTDLVNK